MLPTSDSGSVLLPPENHSLDYGHRQSQQYGPTVSELPTSPSASLLGTASPSQSQSRLSVPRSFSSNDNRASRLSYQSFVSRASTVGDGWGWNDPEPDDHLHNPDPKRDRKRGSVFTMRGVVNIGCLFLLLLGLLILFAGYPVISHFTEKQLTTNGAYNVGGMNATGQVPFIPGFPKPVDDDTPDDVKTWTSAKSQKEYTLTFSDEFNKEGRTFFPGDDPYWQAVDFHYWPTGDMEWYDPSAVTTENGNLKISMTNERNHDLEYKSGMIQSWNQLCFQYSYYIEVNVSLPGNPNVSGFWPGIWTLGNLARPGYGATTEGLWPYTYDSCDRGTLQYQTLPSDNPIYQVDNPDILLSTLPGQRLSACTCKGEDHPGGAFKSRGGVTALGRAAPEVDIIEAQIGWNERSETHVGQVSQSFQVAPFDYGYEYENKSSYIADDTITKYNSYKGGIYQQAVSGVSDVPDDSYNGTGYAVYGVEVFADKDNREKGYISWYSNGKLAWYVDAPAIGENTLSGIGPRIIPEEPMALIMNFGISEGFAKVQLENLVFPAWMYVDYIRVYQIEGVGRIGCDPEDYPTAQYIEDHLNAYQNPNLTTWKQAGYSWPKNNLINSC